MFEKHMLGKLSLSNICCAAKLVCRLQVYRFWTVEDRYHINVTSVHWIWQAKAVFCVAWLFFATLCISAVLQPLSQPRTSLSLTRADSSVTCRCDCWRLDAGNECHASWWPSSMWVRVWGGDIDSVWYSTVCRTMWCPQKATRATQGSCLSDVRA